MDATSIDNRVALLQRVEGYESDKSKRLWWIIDDETYEANRRATDRSARRQLPRGRATQRKASTTTASAGVDATGQDHRLKSRLNVSEKSRFMEDFVADLSRIAFDRGRAR